MPTWGQYVGSAMFILGVYFIAFQQCFSKKKPVENDAELPAENKPETMEEIDEVDYQNLASTDLNKAEVVDNNIHKKYSEEEERA
jgi:hypothetical protein